MLTAACGDDASARVDASADGSPAGHDSGSDARAADGGGRAPDAGRADNDAGHATDAAACEPAKCPNPDIAGGNSIQPYTACCMSDGRCGMGPAHGDADCQPIVEGKPDEHCLDIEVDGKVLEGCCRPDGKCGHQDPKLGCHQLLNWKWSAELRTCTPPALEEAPPNPFTCLPDESPCTYGWQCCRHYNYQTQCSHGTGHAELYCNTCPDC